MWTWTRGKMEFANNDDNCINKLSFFVHWFDVRRMDFLHRPSSFNIILSFNRKAIESSNYSVASMPSTRPSQILIRFSQGKSSRRHYHKTLPSFHVSHVICSQTNRTQSVQAGTVNATAPSPNIRLRITDRNGADIIGAKLGDELYLRIEIDDDSVFGMTFFFLTYMYRRAARWSWTEKKLTPVCWPYFEQKFKIGIFARDLVATSGRNDDSIALLDNSGCSIDHSIFPALKKIARGKALMGTLFFFCLTETFYEFAVICSDFALFFFLFGR